MKQINYIINDIIRMRSYTRCTYEMPKSAITLKGNTRVTTKRNIDLDVEEERSIYLSFADKFIHELKIKKLLHFGKYVYDKDFLQIVCIYDDLYNRNSVKNSASKLKGKENTQETTIKLKTGDDNL